jgi:hypothetical protein
MNLIPDEHSEMAEPYLTGTLPPEMRDEFEEHYVTCKECRNEVEFLMSVRKSLIAQSQVFQVNPSRLTQPWRLFSWQSGMAMATVFLLVGGMFWRLLPRHEHPAVAVSPPLAAPASPVQEPANQQTATSIAALELPPYFPLRLRGSSSADTNFERGMRAYQAGDCASASAALKLVAFPSSQWESAQFYGGACLLKLGDPASAAAALQLAARSGSGYEQPARYYLALADHELGDDAAAVRLLRRLAAQRGDYAARAEAQLQTLPSAR